MYCFRGPDTATAITAQLPVLTPDMPLVDAASAIHTSFSIPPTSAADEFRRLLASSFAASLPREQGGYSRTEVVS